MPVIVCSTKEEKGRVVYMPSGLVIARGGGGGVINWGYVCIRKREVWMWEVKIIRKENGLPAVN